MESSRTPLFNVVVCQTTLANICKHNGRLSTTSNSEYNVFFLVRTSCLNTGYVLFLVHTSCASQQSLL